MDIFHAHVCCSKDRFAQSYGVYVRSSPPLSRAHHKRRTTDEMCARTSLAEDGNENASLSIFGWRQSVTVPTEKNSRTGSNVHAVL